MARRKKVPLVKGPPRVRYLKKNEGRPDIVQDFFCGECGEKTKVSTTQRNAKLAKRDKLPRNEEVARVCDNIKNHKEGKKHFWPIGLVIIQDY